MPGQLGARSKTKTRGMSLEEKEEWKARQAAIHAERLRAELEENQEATLARMDDLNIVRVYPDREDFKGAWILKRTAEMVSLKVRYKFVNSPDSREPEVSLQLFQPDCHGIERPVAIAGDLYRLDIHHPNWMVLRDFHVVVESIESVAAWPRSYLFYSCVNLYNSGVAFTIPTAGWQRRKD